MPVLLCGIGVFALVAGLVMVGFGIPINEFSFGNTLISAGTTAIMGGLIVIALGITVRQLRRIAEALAHQSPISLPPHDLPDPLSPASPASGRAPFTSRPKVEPSAPLGAVPPPAQPVAPSEGRKEAGLAPTLRNPEEVPLPLEDEIALSPQHPTNSVGAGDHGARLRTPASPPFGAAPPNAGERAESLPGWRSPHSSPSPAAPQLRPQQTARFDSMWPADAKPAKSMTAAETKPNLPETNAPVPQKRPDDEPQRARAVAVLKSGVVDGMAYTLYVDGSIEAELPQGTLRFASINELRSHLEKHS